MIVIAFTLLVEADVAEAFPVIADPRSKLVWVPAIRRVAMNSDGPPRLGARYLASSGFGPFEFVFEEQITEWVPGERLAYRGHSRWGAFESHAWLEPTERGTQIRYQMDYAFPASWLSFALGWLLTRVYRRAVEAATVARLKRVIEDGWRPEGMAAAGV